MTFGGSMFVEGSTLRKITSQELCVSGFRVWEVMSGGFWVVRSVDGW